MARGAQFSGASAAQQINQASRLALSHRQRVKEGDLWVFMFPLAFAVIKDGVLDPLTLIPIAGLVGTIGGMFISTYLFIFMWGRGKWKLRIVFFLISLFDIIPGIDLIPFTVACVVYAYLVARADAHESEKALVTLDQKMRALARMARMELQQEALERLQQKSEQQRLVYTGEGR